MEVWRRIDTEREGEEEEGRVKKVNLRFQNGTSEEVRGKERLRSQIVTSEETEFEITICDFKYRGRKDGDFYGIHTGRLRKCSGN